MTFDTDDRIAALHGTIGSQPTQGKAVECEEKNPGFNPRLEAGITIELAPQAPAAPHYPPILESPVLTPMISE
ncbi:MAG: hypothetical protein ABSC42_10320 [Tepidisphaeraceae bacterium]|jgi:hypothetical protein